jgi:hypothetical protein
MNPKLLKCVRYSGMAHFDTLIWPTWILIFCLILPVSVLPSWRERSLVPRFQGRRLGEASAGTAKPRQPDRTVMVASSSFPQSAGTETIPSPFR